MSSSIVPDLPDLLQILALEDADGHTAMDVAVIHRNWTALRCLLSVGGDQVGA